MLSRIELVDAWTTKLGYRIEWYHHICDYPAELRFPGIRPGQTTEMRGWPCPACASTNTSSWGVTTVTDRAFFECHECAAKGPWSIYCKRDTPVHLDGHCDCEWDDGDWSDEGHPGPEDGSWE